MKNTFSFLIFSTLLLSSCTNKETARTVTEKDTTAIAATETRVQTLPEAAEILGDSWISKDYLDNLKKMKAVYTIPPSKNTLFGMSFVKDSLATGNSLLYGFSKHEVSYSWPVYWNEKTGKFEYDPNQDIGDKPLGEFELNLLNNNLVELHFKETGKKEIYQKAYLETELNSLFAGTYTEKATGKAVTFTKEGKVQGLPGFVQYYVQFDPDAEEAVPFDAINLYAKVTDEAGKPFHFKINGDTLTLYNVDEHEVEKYVEYTYTIGKEAFVLTKQ